MKRLRIYIYADTSVFGGFFDEEFSEDTQLLWESFIQGTHRLVLSTLTLRELGQAPEEVMKLLDKVSENYLELLDLSDEAHELALAYIRHGALIPSMEKTHSISP